MSDHPIYEALSYTWGESTNLHEIEINDGRFEVTENLYQFLYSRCRARKDDDQKTLLWIDAICINQSSTTEKGYQVEIMGSIYQSAQLVCTWLGVPQTPNIEHAIRFLGFATNHFGTAQVHKEYQKLFPNSSYDRLILAFESIFQLPYWNRTWIVQEVLHAPNITVMCGTTTIPWDTLDFYTRSTNNIFLAMSQAPPTPYLPIRRFCFEDLADLRNKRATAGAVGTIDTLIDRNLETQCKDPRDRVYAFLSLAERPRHTHMIRADYAKEAEEVFFEVMRFLSEERSNLGVRITDILLEALKLSWPWDLNYENPGEKENALFERDQKFRLRATRKGIVKKIWEPWNLSSIDDGRTKCLLYEAEEKKTRKKDHLPLVPQVNELSGLQSQPLESLFDVQGIGQDSEPVLMRGLANGKIRPGDVVYQFDTMHAGFLARFDVSNSGMHIVSHTPFVEFASLFPDNRRISHEEAKRESRSWILEGYEIKKEDVASDGYRVSIEVGRRELVTVLFDEREIA